MSIIYLMIVAITRLNFKQTLSVLIKLEGSN